MMIDASESAKAFAAILKSHGLDAQPPCPLFDTTFFLGAGFSKSWNSNFPTGIELFKATNSDCFKHLGNALRAASFSDSFILSGLDFEEIKGLVYSLEMNLKYPVIRGRYADNQSLRIAFDQLRTFFASRLLQLSENCWPWFDQDTQKFVFPSSLTSEQSYIARLFGQMFRHVDNSQGHMQGVRFNFITTNYDWLPEAIVDSTLSGDDSSLIYLYRGVTPTSICGLTQHDPSHTHSLVFNLLKLHGGMEVSQFNNLYHFEYRKKAPICWKQRPPLLIMPSREQNYSDDYFQAVFPKAIRLLQESKALVITGYSLPAEDALLRFIIRHFCEDEADSHGKVIFYIDYSNPSKVKETEERMKQQITEVFPFAKRALKVFYYSNGFAKWCEEVTELVG